MKDYIHRLDNFDGPAVGEIAVGYEMFDEAFEIYKKFSLKTQAIKVLLEHHEDLDRALEYALKVRAYAAGFQARAVTRLRPEPLQCCSAAAASGLLPRGRCRGWCACRC